MKNNTDGFIEKSFKTLNKISSPTNEQKETILQKVLIQSQSEKVSILCQLKNMIVVYPWRFAFGVSTIQAISLTRLFGSSYTNFILQFMGR